jgi:hypothetical protein
LGSLTLGITSTASLVKTTQRRAVAKEAGAVS